MGSEIADALAMLDRFEAQATEALGAALRVEGAEIIKASDPNVPRKTGGLVDSHYVTEPRTEDGVVTVEAGYGQADAFFVHQQPHRHPQGGPFFLRNAVASQSSGMAERIAASIEASLNGQAPETSSEFPTTPRTTPTHERKR